MAPARLKTTADGARDLRVPIWQAAWREEGLEEGPTRVAASETGRTIMLLSDIKSRPTYGTLAPSPLATRHIVAVEGAGIRAVETAFGGRPELAGRTTIVFTASPDMPADTPERLDRLGADALHRAPSIETLLVRLSGLLATATMGTQLSLAGSENFLGQAVAVGMAHGLGPNAIATEYSGSPARRVQCVHCKGFTAGSRRARCLAATAA
jgi:hypothetical protein